MKKLLCFILFLAYSASIHAQSYEPQFKFWLAFEDATGAKDTLWLIMDSTANTFGDDPHLGDTMIYDTTSNFKISRNLYLYTDTLREYKIHKVQATGIRNNISTSIDAFNYQLPLTIRYDTNIFNNNGLPYKFKTAYLHNNYSYFYLNNTQSFFIYLKDYISGGWVPDIFDTVILPYVDNNPNFSHFPLWFYLSTDSYSFLNINEVENSQQSKPYIFPNPVSDILNIMYNIDYEYNLVIYNMFGQLVFANKNVGYTDRETIDLSFLEKGIYFLKINNIIIKKATTIKIIKL
jgi:hypothetical protein